MPRSYCWRISTYWTTSATSFCLAVVEWFALTRRLFTFDLQLRNHCPIPVHALVSPALVQSAAIAVRSWTELSHLLGRRFLVCTGSLYPIHAVLWLSLWDLRTFLVRRLICRSSVLPSQRHSSLKSLSLPFVSFARPSDLDFHRQEVSARNKRSVILTRC